MQDLFGNEIPEKFLLRDKFIEPPFSVLDARSGEWQSRKRRWMDLGIKSEEGREQSLTHHIPMGKWSHENMEEEFYEAGKKVGTSVFDPVLCELMYEWFCLKNGTILDPFAGGSVRGVVANYLGFKYTGIELRPEQVESNIKQGKEILEPENQPVWLAGDSEEVLDSLGGNPKIKISRASLLQKFHPCTLNYIENVCLGSCCQGSNGLKVVVGANEAPQIENLGGQVSENYIVADERGLCPFKDDKGTCKIHDLKPFGCKASPFVLTSQDTLIVRNRYRLLRCYDCEGSIPAYQAHKWSLEQIFGEEGYKKIEEGMVGEEDFFVDMPLKNYLQLKENDKNRGKEVENGAGLEQFDFIFSCPPYMDLEVYSDLPSDLSNMSDTEFTSKYQRIIDKCSKMLKKDGYAVFVVGDVRDKETGFYKDFLGITKQCFKKAGLGLYNEAILLSPVGSASMRANRQFSASKKLVKIHQNVLIFKK
jgi:hypothetical protein